MYYPCSDQLRSYCEAYLRHCFRLCRLLVFSCEGSFPIIQHTHPNLFQLLLLSPQYFSSSCVRDHVRVRRRHGDGRPRDFLQLLSLFLRFLEIYTRINQNDKVLFVCDSKHLFFFFFLIQFYVPFKLFHSYRDESIGRWGENRSTRVKTT